MREKLKDRFNILAISFILISAIITSQLFYLQIVKGKEYDDMSQSRLFKEKSIAAPRGQILDRNNIPIAVNRMAFTVQISKVKMDMDLNDMLLRLIGIFDKNGDTYNKSLSKYLTFNPLDFGQTVRQVDNKVERFRSFTGFKLNGLDSNASAKDIFEALKKEYKISDKYTDEEAYKLMTIRTEMLGYSALNPVCIAKDVSKETVAEIEERHMEFPGVTTDVEYMRKYIDADLAAHVIGYLGIISPNDYKNLKDEGYGMNDIIGQTGVERAVESFLRGKAGQRREEVDVKGRQTEELGENPAIPGSDVVLTLDMKLQKVAMESLERNINEIRSKADGKKNMGDASAGAVVALDVNTGEVLATASYPGYDPALFVENPEDKEVQQRKLELFTDETNKPMRNRVIQDIFAPGSTYKPLTAIAALEEKVITPEQKILDEGVYNIGGMDFKCMEYRDYGWTHGYENLEEALKTSCNIYFHKVGYQTGIDNIDKWAKLFGLGEKTGIDVDSASEERGIRANKDYKTKVFKDDWRPADTAQAAIGQLYNAFTPIQLVNYVATIANGGKKFKPHLIKRVVKYDGSIVKETQPEYEQIPVKPETMDAVKKGMLAVVNANDGTAAEAFKDFKFDVAGKTGTAETGFSNHSSNALFVCYAPANDPKIAVAVVVERGAWGAYTAPIARDVLAEYFNINSQSTGDDKVKPEEITFTR